MAITVILGDPHVGRSLTLGRAGIGSELNSRVVDQLNILDWVLLKSIEEGAENIIITGDVFEDTKPHPTLIALFMSWLKSCSASDVSVHIIQGNHDILRSGQFYVSALDVISEAEIENVFVYKDIATIHTSGASFTLIPFRDRRSFDTSSNLEALSLLSSKFPYELAEINRNFHKVVIGHLTIDKAIPVGDEIDDLTNELFCPLEMFEGYDYVWMGHIHKPQILQKHPYIAHIGSMDLSNFSESEHTKLITVFDSSKSQPFKYLEIPTRPLKQISISVPFDIVDSTNFVSNKILTSDSLSKAIIRLNVSFDNPGAISLDRKKIEEDLNSMGAFYISRIDEHRKISSIKKDENNKIDNTITEGTAIKMYADMNIEEEMKSSFTTLANSLIKEFIAETDK
jgi:exonuclease SbcD